MSNYKYSAFLIATITLIGITGCGESLPDAEQAADVVEQLEPGTPQADIPPVAVRNWQSKEPGTIVEVLDAASLSRIDGSSQALFVRYTTTDVKGSPALASGIVLFPESTNYKEGELPLVVYGHMTTGAADACAPSHSSPDSTELQKMQQGDKVARQLLGLGAVVARPDYEGIGEAGPHPYLRGDSLARSMRDMASAVANYWPEIGGSWVAAGHSEGGVAALNTGNRMLPEARGLNLVGIVSITPVTQLEKLLLIAAPLPIAGPPLNEAVALSALVLSGISTVDASFKRLLFDEGGLSERAIELWPDIERLCLADLSGKDSWGGLSPAELKGPRGNEALAEMRRSLDADDVRFLPMRRDVPIRIDAGILDAVALLPFTEQLVQTYRNSGNDVTFKRWLAAHSPTADIAASEIASWIIERFKK